MTPEGTKTVVEAAESGDKRGTLVAMRTRIAESVASATTPARDLAALTKRLMEVMNEIEAIDARDEQEAAHVVPTSDDTFIASAI